mmetsp:Transcript_31747/g.48612  ORF Transcript_31747/g.48612 Transcript_31747/m.48612 type:complete len:139 (+) Transcript_31747:390-806(+)
MPHENTTKASAASRGMLRPPFHQDTLDHRRLPPLSKGSKTVSSWASVLIQRPHHHPGQVHQEGEDPHNQTNEQARTCIHPTNDQLSMGIIPTPRNILRLFQTKKNRFYCCKAACFYSLKKMMGTGRELVIFVEASFFN